jgi:hypothetical protein
MTDDKRVYNDILYSSMGAAYEQACEETPHAALFPEIQRVLAEHILADVDRGVTVEAELCANAVAAFTTPATLT